MLTSLNLKSSINCARRCRATLDEVYLVLALVESGATDTPFFHGLEHDDLIATVLNMVNVRQKEFNDKYLEEYTSDDFLGFLCHQQEFCKTSAAALRTILAAIKQQGEEHYGFTKFS